MAVYGNLDVTIVNAVKADFYQKCINLLAWACYELKGLKQVDTGWGEENITANIYTYIKNCQLAIDEDIFVESEHPFYSQAILDNLKKAKSASRIDMVFQHNWSGNRFCFYVEAKNLVEYNYLKKGNQKPSSAKKVLVRYITTGIDHYLKGHYPLGCLLGYVLNGNVISIADKINFLLTNRGRGNEVLFCCSYSTPYYHFKSTHASYSMELDHFWFDFN